MNNNILRVALMTNNTSLLCQPKNTPKLHWKHIYWVASRFEI